MTGNGLLKIFSSIPELETERLLLRKLKITDAEDMYEYSRQDEVTRYLLWRPHPDSNYTVRYLADIVIKYRTGDFLDWAVELKSEGKMIGTCGFTTFDNYNRCAEIGYVLNPAYWGAGLASEAAMCVIA